MKKFIVDVDEVIEYEFEVEADTEDEAVDKVMTRTLTAKKTKSTDFCILAAREVKPPMHEDNPHSTFMSRLHLSLKDFEASGNHDHQGYEFPGDCVACGVRLAIGMPQVRKA